MFHGGKLFSVRCICWGLMLLMEKHCWTIVQEATNRQKLYPRMQPPLFSSSNYNLGTKSQYVFISILQCYHINDHSQGDLTTFGINHIRKIFFIKILPNCLEACHMFSHHFYVILHHYHWLSLQTCKDFIAFILVPYFELKHEY